METAFKDFYDTLIENLETYSGEYESFIDYGPSLFKTLCDLLNCEIDYSLKLPICGAIAYYVAPDDIISEQLYGPYGYIDDIYLSSYVLKMVADKHGYDFITLGFICNRFVKEKTNTEFFKIRFTAETLINKCCRKAVFRI